MAYRKGASWPPPAKFSQSGPIGFVYVLQMWFRYYPHEWLMGAGGRYSGRAGLTVGTESYRKQKEAIGERNLTLVQTIEKLGNAKQGFMPKMLALGAA
jgi:hypothetical protein